MFGIKNLKNHPAMLDAGFAITGNVAGAAVSGLAMIILSRTLGPEVFGVISVGFSLMLIAARVAEGGLVASLLKYFPTLTSHDQERQLFWTTLLFKLFLGVSLAILLSVASPWLAKILHISVELVLIVAWLNLVTLVFDHLGGVTMAMLKIKFAVIANFAQALIKLGIAVLTIFNPLLSASSILAAYIAAPGPVTLLYKRLLPSRIWQRPAVLPWKEIYFKIRNMAAHNWVAGISSAVLQNVDVLIVSSLLLRVEVGYIGAATRIALLLSIVGASLAGVVNPRVAKLQDHKQLKQYWGKATLILVGMLIVAIFVPFTSRLLLTYTTGPEYLPAAGVLSWLLVATCFSIGLTPFVALFFRYHEARYFSVAAIMQALIMCFGSYFAVQEFGMDAVGWVRVASQAVVLVLTVGWAIMAHQREFKTLPWK